MTARFVAVLTSIAAVAACAANPIDAKGTALAPPLEALRVEISSTATPAESISVEEAEPLAPAKSVCVEVSLRDGSRIVGTPVLDAIHIQTPYATFAVDLQHLDLITARAEDAEFKLTLANGDRVSGRLTSESFDVAASFGRVSLRTAVICEIQVRRNVSGIPERLKEDLALHYSFDKDEGDMVSDQSRNHHDGRVQNTTWLHDEGKGSGCLAFDGTSSIVNVGHPPSLNITRDLTISAWLSKPSRPHFEALQTILAKDNKPEGSGRSYMFYVFDEVEASRLVFSYGISESNKGIRNDFSSPGLPLADGKWHHVAIVHKTGEGNRIFFDGALVAQDEEGSPLPLNPQTDVLLGKTRSWETWFFLGRMDDIMVFRSALSNAEIAELYRAQRLR